LQTGIGLANERVRLADGADDGGSFLSLADEEDSLVGSEPGEVFASEVVLALVACQRDQVESLLLRELFDRLNERARHPRHGLGRGEDLAAMLAEEPGDLVLALQARLDDIDI